MATVGLLRLEAPPPPPIADADKKASEELLRRVDEAINTLRREAQGLTNAREEYRRRLEGTRVGQP